MQLLPSVACLLSPSPPPAAGNADRSRISSRVFFKPLEKNVNMFIKYIF